MKDATPQPATRNVSLMIHTSIVSSKSVVIYLVDCLVKLERNAHTTGVTLLTFAFFLCLFSSELSVSQTSSVSIYDA